MRRVSQGVPMRRHSNASRQRIDADMQDLQISENKTPTIPSASASQQQTAEPFPMDDENSDSAPTLSPSTSSSEASTIRQDPNGLRDRGPDHIMVFDENSLGPPPPLWSPTRDTTGASGLPAGVQSFVLYHAGRPLSHGRTQCLTLDLDRLSHVEVLRFEYQGQMEIRITYLPGAEPQGREGEGA